MYTTTLKSEVKSTILKNFDGYRSFEYLIPGKHYKPFQLPQSEKYRQTEEIKLREDQERIFETLLKYYPIISLRDHGFVVPKNQEDIIPYCRQLHTFFDYEGLALSGVDV